MAKYKLNNRELNKIYDSLYRKVYEVSYPWMMAPNKSSKLQSKIDEFKNIMDSQAISIDIANHKELYLLTAIFIEYIHELNNNKESLSEIANFIKDFFDNVLPALGCNDNLIITLQQELLNHTIGINQNLQNNTIIKNYQQQIELINNKDQVKKNNVIQQEKFNIDDIKFSEEQINSFYLKIIDEALESAIRKKLAKISNNNVPYKVDIDPKIRNQMLLMIKKVYN